MRADYRTDPWALTDPRPVLTTILELGAARPGLTVVAHLDHESEEVLGVRTLVTPQPARRLGPGWDSEAEEARSRLSARLKSVARELVPRRTWTGTGWSIPARETSGW